MTKWELDKQIEEKVAEFTDTYFWSKLPSHREQSLSAQYAGIDVQLSCNSRVVNFDEKAKIRGCLNSILQYPSFELEMTSRSGVRREGWFLANTIQTDYYAFIGVFASTADENKLTADNMISAVDMLWVKKSDVKQMISGQIDDDQLKKDITDIQDEDCLDELIGWNFGKIRKKYEHGLFWLTYSTKLKEHPVNLVTTRDQLEKLPHSKHFYITKDKIENIPLHNKK